MKVALVARGPSRQAYIDLVDEAGGRHAVFDEVWTVNALGGVIQSDLVWHMDDVRVQQERAMYNSHIRGMLKWLKRHLGPVMTSRAHPDYPGLVEYPLEDVVRAFQVPYFTGTIPYAIAYAALRSVRELHLFGVDYTYANTAKAEAGRACTEYWIGRASQAGTRVVVTPTSTLLDTNKPLALYGYDTRTVTIDWLDRDDPRISYADKEPDIQDIEHRYRSAA